MPGLERLLYRSVATGSTESLLNVATLLGEAQRNNARDDLTGALAAHNGWFVQVVEGRREQLDRLLTRLATDPRHRDISVIDRTPVSDRMFQDWSMANARITPSLKRALDDLVTDPEARPGRLVEMLHEAAQPA